MSPDSESPRNENSQQQNSSLQGPALQSLLSKQLLMITGKGGTGKTMLALALAQQAASFGKRVLLVESHYMGKVLSLSPNMAIDEPKIKHLNLSYAKTFQDFVDAEFAGKPLVRKLFQADFLRKFLSSIPAFNELIFLGELVQLAKRKITNQSYDLVIYDGFASGHFYSLLRTPEGIAESGIGGRIGQEAAKIQAYMQDPKHVAVVMASLMQPLVMSESVEFARKLCKVIKPEQLTLAPRQPLSFYCDKKPHAAAIQAMLDNLAAQANTAEQNLRDWHDQQPASQIMWIQDIGGLKAENIKCLYRSMLQAEGLFV